MNDGPTDREHAPTALRGAAVTSRGDPFVSEGALRYERGALLVMRGGRIVAFGPAAELLPALGNDVPVTQYGHALLMPGFIDAHVHYPQLPAIGAFGRTLLEWLEHHTFAVEQACGAPVLARVTAEVFLD